MKNITIHTAQNVPIEYELASSQNRIFAALLDVIAFFFCYLVLFLVIASMGASALTDRFGAVFFMQYFPMFLFLCYLAAFDVLLGGSLGKRALKIRVIRLDGKELSLGDHAIRAAFYLIDCFLTLGFMAIVLVMSTEKGQRLGDMAANTTVIKLRPTNTFSLTDILSISSLDSYQPVYTQVVNLKEEDMLLVKTILNRARTYQNTAHQTAVSDCAAHLQTILGIDDFNGNDFTFLNTILKDYIVLTR
jgi:uncharacterized RDD family membrane protein YckC